MGLGEDCACRTVLESLDGDCRGGVVPGSRGWGSDRVGEPACGVPVPLNPPQPLPHALQRYPGSPPGRFEAFFRPV